MWFRTEKFSKDHKMFGGEPSEEERKLQEQMAYDNLKLAGIIAGALWLTPVIYNFVKKQL